jgi:PIN domain nuclease of toxin-antitoxin system
VRLLLDTHALVWWDTGALPAPVTRRIQRASEVFVSAATAWEIAIKVALGRLRMTSSVAEVAAAYGFRELPVTFAHAHRVLGLPPVHRDPFDRLLVAQAGVEELTLLSRDRALAEYGVTVVWS